MQETITVCLPSAHRLLFLASFIPIWFAVRGLPLSLWLEAHSALSLTLFRPDFDFRFPYGSLGAAIATVIGYLCSDLYFLGLLHKKEPLSVYLFWLLQSKFWGIKANPWCWHYSSADQFDAKPHCHCVKSISSLLRQWSNRSNGNCSKNQYDRPACHDWICLRCRSTFWLSVRCKAAWWIEEIDSILHELFNCDRPYFNNCLVRKISIFHEHFRTGFWADYTWLSNATLAGNQLCIRRNYPNMYGTFSGNRKNSSRHFYCQSADRELSFLSCFWFFAALFGYNGILMAQAIADVLSAVLAMFLLYRIKLISSIA